MERVYKKLAHQTYGVGGVRGKAISTAEKVFLAKKKKMIQEILHHAISKEIANGPTAHHKTGILGEIDKPMGSVDGKILFIKMLLTYARNSPTNPAIRQMVTASIKN